MIFTLATSACRKGKSSGDIALKNLLTEYIGRILTLPADSACFLLDRGYGLDFLDTDYLIVSYIDTEGCTPCHLHLPYWKELCERLDTISGVYATCVLIIRPDTIEKVTDFIRNANYDYPVIIDTLGIFTEMNRLPELQPLHTLLIDNNRTILGLGNPIENRAIDRIYTQIISGRKFETDEKSQLSIDNNTVDIGTVPLGAERELEFLVKNQSNDTISVSNVMTPCDCIDASATDIMPSSIGSIKIAFRASDFCGAFHHPIVVRYNNSARPIIIHLYGIVSL
ncbi:MAG: DUF1573 domain-containing protein [Muribaculaceae bacterium]|nr:DUF1573 domain-containing protein [Muribaculaceae bacterium]